MYQKVINEAIEQLHISDKPGLYKRIRRWARANIKHEAVDPIDIISWPKGCLLLGLMHQAHMLIGSEDAPAKAYAIRSAAEVKEYIDLWISEGCQIYKIDDAIAGMAVLLLAVFFEPESEEREHYLRAADVIMDYLYLQNRDSDGAYLYRPAHNDGKVFADGVGMTAPFMIYYGILRNDDQAILIGLDQIQAFVKNASSDKGLLWHAYSLSEGVVQTFGADDWCRAAGWVMFGIQEAIFAIEKEGLNDNFNLIRTYNELITFRKKLCNRLTAYAREDGLFSSRISDSASPVDTSGSAMILYAMICENETGKKAAWALKGYITDDGKVMGAQGECMGLGIYSQNYGSYPWSVGMTLLFDLKK